MTYRLINGNALIYALPDIVDMPCVYADLPNGLDGKHYNLMERKHGHWNIFEAYGITIAECSECKRTMPTPINKNGATPFRYCPYCGCDMRGKDE